MADLTQAFAPGNASDDLGKTDFFDFVVSPPPHCPSSGGISDDENYLHRTNCRDINYLQDDHDMHDIHTTSTSFIKETNNNTLTALPPVSTITGSLNHHHHNNHHHNNNNNNNHHVRNHCIQNTDELPMDQSDCDYWGTDDSKEQTCNILLEDLNKYCWSTHTTNTQNQNDIHSNNEHPVHRITTTTTTQTTNDRHHNTDGAIYTLTVLNNEGNSMDGLDCCKSPTAPSSEPWSLRPSIDLDAILNLESSTNDQDTNDRIPERYHIIPTPTSQYTDDSGFVESKELCRQNNINNNNININNNNINNINNNNINTNNNNNNNNTINNNNNNTTNTNNNSINNNSNNTTTTTPTTTATTKKLTTGDNNNDWKLTDQNHLHDTVVVATVSNDSAESLLRSALQGKLYSGTTQIVSPSSSQSSTISLSVSSNNSLQLIEHQQQQQTQTSQDTQQQQNESMETCTEDDFLLSQFDTDNYQPDDYEKIKRIADDVVKTYCNNMEQPVTATTTTLMYTLDPTNGSLGTITLPAELGHVGTVTVVATQPDLLQTTSTTLRNDNDNQTTNNQIQITATPSTTTTASSLSSSGSSSGSSSSIISTTTTTSTNNNNNNLITTKTTKKYCRRSNKNSNNNSNSNNSNNHPSTSGASGNGNSHQQAGCSSGASGSSPSAAQRKERSLHYCSICSKGFKDKYSVNVHIRTHTGEKPFACSLCGKSFRQKAHLAKHHQTHNAQKPNVTNGNASNSSPTESTTNSRGSISIDMAASHQSN